MGIKGLLNVVGKEPVCDEGKRVIGAVSDDRSDQASALKIHDAEYQAVNAGCYNPLHALHIVPCSEADAPQHKTHSRTTEVQPKTRQDERALQFLFNSAGN